MDADEATRVRQGASTATAPSVLARLAGDSSVKVRATLALNPAAPPQVHRMLAHDSDERVRVLLARKLGALMPSLSDSAQSSLREQAFQTLTALVADEAVRVRAAVAEEVKQLPDVPRALILRLAQDTSVMVCEPVILFSPLLSTADLVALVAAAPSPATVSAVARRARIDEAVSDAVAGTADSEAIKALLRNSSAQIREATLDALIARAEAETDWHEPLVNRPLLSARAAQALSEIVATHLLEVLAARPDLDPKVTRELQQHLSERLVPEPRQSVAAPEVTLERAMETARALASDGKLSETTILDAARHGELRLTMALLAVAADVSVSVVERAASLRSTKGIVSLAWKAGFSMRVATALQPLLARLAPDAILRAGPGGTFPLAPDEMRWQIDFLGRTGR
jgi:uncharacterized protein (DUF2336 family)